VEGKVNRPRIEDELFSNRFQKLAGRHEPIGDSFASLNLGKGQNTKGQA
jgi:hypothetical protein